KMTRTRVAQHRRKKAPLPIRKIAISAGVAAAVLIAVFYANSYALDNMQFKVNDVSEFNFASLTSDVNLEACNPTVFPASFDRFSAVVHYKQGEFARMNVNGGMLMPYQAAPFNGELKLSAQTVSGLVIALADAVGGKDSPYNEGDITLTVTVDARVLGIAPYSQTRQFTFSEFQQFMANQPGADHYLCG
ncbi:MAG TPA: hypothetical protein VJP79_10915, partial [Nitrososphaera sp.]|nr:hypothetical protein [Nitrososphaera sp.]